MRRAIAAASFLTILLPVAAQAAAPASHHVLRNARAVAIERRAMLRWPALQRAELRRLGRAVGSAGSADQRAIGPNTYLVNPPVLTPAGNLAGTGHPVVLDTRQSTYSSTVDGKFGITARDGRTGRGLWHEVLSEHPDDFISITLARLGAKGAPGLLAIDEYPTMSAGQIVGENLRIRALAGRSGKLMWTRTLTGSFGAGDTQAGIPSIDGVFHDAAGPDDDVLVSLETTLPSPSGFETVPEIVSGVDGATHQPGDSFMSAAGYPAFSTLPDVNGDGFADMLVLIPGTPGLIQAERGHSGALIWNSSAVPVNGFETSAMVLGRFSHSSYADIGIVSGGGPTLGFQLTVLNGRTGQEVWSRPASQVILLGRAGRHLVPALGLISDALPTTSLTTTTDELSYAAISATNKVIYSRDLSVSVKNSSGGGTQVNISTFRFGDVEPDGSAETFASIALVVTSPSGDTSKTLAGYIDGRYGAFRPVSFDTATDGSLRSGRGTDLLATVTTTNVLALTARNGVSRKRYYQHNVAGLQGVFQHLTVSGVRVSGHNCSDLALTTVLGSDGVLGVLSARGAWLWSVRFSDKAMTGGALRHYKAPKDYCV